MQLCQVFQTSILVSIRIIKMLAVLIGLTLTVVACGGGGDTTSETTDTVDSNAPTITASSNRLLNENSPIVLTFNESIDTASFSVTGSLFDESDGGVWSQSNEIDDTLTLSPTSSWSVNTLRTLTINVSDLTGNVAAEINQTYDVYKGTLLYVSSTAADDSGDGLSITNAKASILNAINSAIAPATVVVTAGAYAVSDTPESRIELVADVSLYGGYSADFTTREPKSSVVTSATTYVIHGTGSSVSDTTLIDGFTLQGPENAATPTIHLLTEASPTVQNNTIRGNFGIHNQFASPVIVGNSFEINSSANTICTGIFNDNASPIIQSNIIEIDGTNQLCISGNYGVWNSASSPIISNNTIDAGFFIGEGIGIYNTASFPVINDNIIIGGTTIVGNFQSSAGIYNEASGAVISNNIIDSGNGGLIESAGIRNVGSSSVILNNIINSTGATTSAIFVDFSGFGSTRIIGNTLTSSSYCIRETANSSDVLSLKFNNFKSCGTLYLDEGVTDITDISVVNNLADIAEGSDENYISP